MRPIVVKLIYAALFAGASLLLTATLAYAGGGTGGDHCNLIYPLFR